MQLFDRVPLRTIPPNLITASGMVVGLLSIVLSIKGQYATAAWFIALATLIDKLDGSVARAFRGSSDFGVQFDSFSDFITFGVAPAALIYGLAPALAPDAWSASASPIFGLLPVEPTFIVLCLLYPVSTAARLAKFNISTSEHPRFFQGLPSTLSGGMLALTFLAPSQLGVPESQLAAILPFMLAANAVLMLCNLPLPKLRAWDHPALKAFQIINVIAIYLMVPLRVALWYPLFVLLAYVLVGFVVGLRAQAGSQAADQVEVAG